MSAKIFWLMFWVVLSTLLNVLFVYDISKEYWFLTLLESSAVILSMIFVVIAAMEIKIGISKQ